MNKRDRAILFTLITEWELHENNSTSAAAAIGGCARDLIRDFGLTDDDLQFDRAYTIAKKCKRAEDENFIDAVYDLFERKGHSAVMDAIDRYDNWELFTGFIEAGYQAS